ncbi:MAG TPA: CPBP family intramembrane metalloprotease [Clostridia bacterium]|nr:CPBP family intramembrane metalloprotease [Clostridia bacterium]
MGLPTNRGEEIAWRAFFQNTFSKILPIVPVLFITSLLFTLGHYEPGNTMVIIFGLIFTFINSIFYGIIFHKTKMLGLAHSRILRLTYLKLHYLYLYDSIISIARHSYEEN